MQFCQRRKQHKTDLISMKSILHIITTLTNDSYFDLTLGIAVL